MPMIETAVYDTKPYDREYLTRADCGNDIAFRFHEFRLSAETALSAKGTQVVCIFVNDQADRACLEALAALEVKTLALRLLERAVSVRQDSFALSQIPARPLDTFSNARQY